MLEKPLVTETVEIVAEPEPVVSTYKFSYEVPDKVIAGESYTVPVTIEPETEGTVGYERVRFDVEVTTPDGATLQLLAEDTNGVVHDVAQIGYWGPEYGFPIGPDYKATTEFTAIFSAPGEYTITFSLVDLDAGEALVTETVEIVAEPEPVVSTYKFSYEVPDKVIAGESYTVPVTIEPETEGTVGYERVRFDVEVTTPDGATLQLLAEDTNGVVHDVAQIGYWGPEYGFPIGPDYKATTEFTAIFSAPGEYTITFSLVDLDAGEALVTETVEIVAEPEPVVSTYKFSYEVPDKVIAGESYTVPVTIEPETEGTVGYERVRFDVEVTTPDGATLQLLAEDTNGVVHDVAQIGYWGPEYGFPIGPDYKATTEFTAIFSAPRRVHHHFQPGGFGCWRSPGYRDSGDCSRA
jgi:hypothetical protein